MKPRIPNGCFVASCGLCLIPNDQKMKRGADSDLENLRKCKWCPLGGCPSWRCLVLSAGADYNGGCCLSSSYPPKCVMCNHWKRLLLLIGIHRFRPTSAIAVLPKDVLRYILLPLIRMY